MSPTYEERARAWVRVVRAFSGSQQAEAASLTALLSEVAREAEERGAKLPSAEALALAEKRARVTPNELMDRVAVALYTSRATWEEIQTAGRYLHAIRALGAGPKEGGK